MGQDSWLETGTFNAHALTKIYWERRLELALYRNSKQQINTIFYNIYGNKFRCVNNLFKWSDCWLLNRKVLKTRERWVKRFHRRPRNNASVLSRVTTRRSALHGVVPVAEMPRVAFSGEIPEIPCSIHRNWDVSRPGHVIKWN